MTFTIEKAVEILERTPNVLYTMLHNISSDWTSKNEGGETWNVYDIIGHLIHCEESDWLFRTEIILSENASQIWEPFNRFAQFKKSKGKSFEQLLDEFKSLRKKNVERLLSKKLTYEDLAKKGMHPSFGEVTLKQLLSSWVAHDLNHISQISRVMAKQYKDEVGPWINYIGILQK